MRKFTVSPKSKIVASELPTKYWTVSCGFEDGDGESGMMVSSCNQVVEAATPEEAVLKINEMFADDNSFIGCGDPRESTQIEIEEYEYYEKPGGPGYCEPY